MTSKRVFVLLSGIVLALLVLNLASAITGKIGNARAVLYPEVGFWGTSIDRTIYVENVNNEAVNVTINSGNSTLIKLIDKSFILGPGESRDAAFTINLKKAGDYDEKLSIFFTPLDGKSAGVVLSASYIIHASEKSSDSGDDSGLNDSDSGISGNAIKMQNFVADNKAVIAVSISTLVLAMLLIVLVYISKKRGQINLKRSERRR